MFVGVIGASSVGAAFLCETPASFARLTATGPATEGEVLRATAAAPAVPIVNDVPNLQRAVAKARASGDTGGLADALVALAEAQIHLGDPGAAAAPIREAVTIRSTSTKNPQKLADALFTHGWALLLAGERSADAVAPLTQALAIRTRGGGPAAQIASTLTLLSWAEREAGDVPASVTVSRRLVSLARTERESVDLGSALETLGVNLVVGGDPAGAIPVLREAITLRTPSGGSALAESLQSLGWALIETNSAATAIEPLRRATTLRRRFNPGSLELANALQLLSRAELDGRNYAEATKAQAEVVALVRNGTPAGALPDVLDSYGTTLVFAGDAPRAATVLAEAVRRRDGPDSPALAASLHALGWALVTSDRPRDATAVLNRAASMRDRLGLTKDAELSRSLLPAASR